MIQEKAFLTIADGIKKKNQLFIDQQLLPIQAIDIYLEQYQRTEEYELFRTPAVFLELSTTIDASRRSVSGELSITTHLVIDPKILTEFSKETHANLRLYRYRALLSHIVTDCFTKEFAKPKLVTQSAIEVSDVFYIMRDAYVAPYNHYNEYDTITNTEGNHPLGMINRPKVK